MSVVSAVPLTSIACMVVERDPAVCRLLSFLLQGRSLPWQIVAEVSTAEAAWNRLLALQPTPQQIRLVILGLPLLDSEADRRSGLDLCRDLKSVQANLRIVLLVDPQDPGLGQAWELGIEGCVARDEASLENVLAVMTRAILGDRCWLVELEQSSEGSQSTAIVPRSQSGLGFQQSLNQIDPVLEALERRLRSGHLSWLERQMLQGRCRELRAARWLIQRLASQTLPSPSSVKPSSPPIPTGDRPRVKPSAPLPSPPSPNPLPPQTLQDILFERMTAKLSGSLENLETVPLEIDVLRRDRKQELLYLILRKFEAILQELALSQWSIEQLASKRPAILIDLWESAVINFFGKYYTLQAESQAIEVVPILLRSGETVNRDILDKIPLVPELLSYLLLQAPLTIDNAIYPASSAEAIDRATCLLENLVIQIGNAVIQPLLNQFADWEPIKQSFYDRRHLSTREIERFRNDLSWRYRRDRYFDEPTHIFESQYRLWTLTQSGIRRCTIYSPRRPELETLSGIPLAVTLLLETRDAIAPRLRATAAFIGSGVVYLLTEVVGRGLGLIGRGIAKGIGDAWQGRR